MRCLALGQAWQDLGGQVTLGMAMTAPALQQRLQSEGMAVARLSAPPGSLEDARETVALARQKGINHLVVDGYHFGGSYQRIFKDAGFKLLFVDDYGHADHYYADMVLNQNIYAQESFYRKREPYTLLLLGTDYVLLRREFLNWRDWQREIPEVARKVLVTLGGSDPANVTLKVLQALKKIRVAGVEVVAVTGGINSHHQELRAEIEHAEIPMGLKHNVADMPELMAWAEVAVSAGGSTCWELAFMGLSSCIIILAANQAMVAETLQKRGLAVNAGWFDAVDQITLSRALEDLLRNKERRLKMGREGRNLVNGNGSHTAVALLRDI
jgi:UDP-2,4-diacetamido-2,4,6-trideoxy-beta-L-altropyranose hydrolase